MIVGKPWSSDSHSISSSLASFPSTFARWKPLWLLLSMHQIPIPSLPLWPLSHLHFPDGGLFHISMQQCLEMTINKVDRLKALKLRFPTDITASQHQLALLSSFMHVNIRHNCHICQICHICKAMENPPVHHFFKASATNVCLSVWLLINTSSSKKQLGN